MDYKYNIEKKFKRQWQKKIINWYEINKRDLPWRKRNNQNFYKIWISEVMLQQTIVKTVIPYYEKFIKKWPNLKSFYNASLDEILLHWQGLGYYQRARNLFKAKEYLKKNRLFISSSNLKQIPGIGDYISCSISAILKDENCAVVDGNIKRIIKRVFNLNESSKFFKKQIYYIAKELTPDLKNGIYCQSLMDFANLVCKVKKPYCEKCIVKNLCKFDGKQKKLNKKPIINKLGIGFFIRENKNFLVGISKKKLFQGLYSIPFSDFFNNTENTEKELIDRIILDWMSLHNISQKYQILGYVNHIFSHFHLKLFVVDIKLKSKINLVNYKWMTHRAYNSKPKSSLMMKVKKLMICI